MPGVSSDIALGDGGQSGPFPPVAYLVGAQKAGTTYLASLLDQAPDICLAAPKEPHFFTQHWHDGVDFYRRCFKDDAADVFLDASTSYSAAPVHRGMEAARDPASSRLAGVPERIRAMQPQARFIYLIRDPVARLWSSYWHDVRIGEQSAPFREVIERYPYYADMSEYLAQIRLYREHFPGERFLFLRFEDLQSDPESVVRQCRCFLGLDSNVGLSVDQGSTHASYNPGRVAGALIRAARRSEGLRRAQQSVWRCLPATVQQGLKRRLTRPVPTMDDESRQLLEARFAPMVAPLEEATGLDLSEWRWRYQYVDSTE
ncbi:MAG: sulfotransferase domain-containing protein [Spiribacter salinus]|uniref:Sulfotransferase domain-containing protein n=1 Tax=Spiribacter salinus TaxID=1335746 RepID=A0A540VQD6_9GAMM|nr:MAG: sulfotransferase domain-containing protein [Spiribacter salinus]